MTRLVVAVGGNALAADGSFDAQRRTVAETAESLAAAVDAEDALVLTHGNGPQVGNKLLEVAAADTPDRPLDVLVAETQASLGSLLGRALDARLDRPVSTLVTRAVVDPESSAFANPTKPIGPWYTEEEAADKPFETKDVGEGERSYRRVVPSPEPTAVPETGAVDALLEAGEAVICGGGGGIPVAPEDDGSESIEAVIDKDYTASIVADAIDADRLVFLTDVDYAYLNYGTDDQQALESVTPGEVRGYLDADEFGEGSMGPKMAACARFAEEGGEAVIASIDDPAAALHGKTGTTVRLD
ncbi:carbamate kinase [Natronomonas halophila]|uniref:amino acid kinase family protein n=1 Tax=Natronomonas halophila TaxID=2747817 RepID=UPI0015B3BED3|nr:carbamate kinase [Natronomonas halophila]QLD87169.1 carbamate kinase [Natronomonas halophila]